MYIDYLGYIFIFVFVWVLFSWIRGVDFFLWKLFEFVKNDELVECDGVLECIKFIINFGFEVMGGSFMLFSNMVIIWVMYGWVDVIVCVYNSVIWRIFRILFFMYVFKSFLFIMYNKLFFVLSF